MAYRDSAGRVHVGHTDCPTEHAIMVRDFCRDEAMAEEHQREQFDEACFNIQQALDAIKAGRSRDENMANCLALMTAITDLITEGYEDFGIVGRTILHPLKRGSDEANILLEAWRHITGSDSATSQSQ